MSFSSTVLEVNLADPLHVTQVVHEEIAEPQDGQLVLSVDRFGLSANNISYALLGNQFGLNFFKPFPAADGWGRVPAWGIARVLAGDPTLADVGDRFVGYVPMADHMVLHARPTDSGLVDTSALREGMLPLYRRMRRVSTDPVWREDLLDLELLLRPAYPPAALLADGLHEQSVTSVALTSATSKTALMLGRLLTERGISTTGLTSPSHLEAAASTDAYTRVLSYDDVVALILAPTVLVDVAGNPEVTRAIYTHLGPQLKRNIVVGGTHHDAAPDFDAGSPSALTPAPELFNTGRREVELAESRGEQYPTELEDTARKLLLPWAVRWLRIHTYTGPEDVERAWRELSRPSKGSPLTGAAASIA